MTAPNRAAVATHFVSVRDIDWPLAEAGTMRPGPEALTVVSCSGGYAVPEAARLS